MRFILQSMAKGFVITVVSIAIWIVIILCLVFNTEVAVNIIQLDAEEWQCQALDPSDGQCAVWVKNSPNPQQP